MKKLLWLGILLGICLTIPHTAEAAIRKYTLNDSNTTGGTITINSGTSATFHLVFPVVKGVSYNPLVCITTTKVDCGFKVQPFNKQLANVSSKAVTWDYTLDNLDPTKTYFLGMLGANGYKSPTIHEFFTGNETFSETPVLNTTKDGDDVIVSTKMDPAKYPYYQELSGTLVYSKSNTLADPINGGALTGRQGPDAASLEGINTVSSPGGLFWRLTNLSPSTVYYFQATIRSTVGDTIKSAITSVNSSNGVAIAPGSIAEKSDLNKRSYTLLSGFPNFTVLPDPDLCAQERAAGQTPQFCDLNDVLNYALKLLIGLSAVSLVFRIMYEGYVVITSDTPFKVSSAKNGLVTASLGLLLALSAYLILNTINPKLVNQTINIQQLAIGVTQPDEDVTPIINQGTISIPTGAVGACPAGITQVKVKNASFYACKNIAPGLTSMITAAYAANITLGGGGFRTKNEQTALRIEHCAGNTTDPKAVCKPPTAVPGFSNHESGLAFDLTCEGKLINDHSNKCFVWLQANAGAYGFKNFAKEPWHWSVDGR